MLVFVTIGSTRFDSLVQSAVSQPVLSALRLKGYTGLIIQSGNSDFEFTPSIASGQTVRLEKGGIDVELWKFKPTLQAEYERADLVISHAGSGTILEVLRLGKPMIVVPNPTLLDNHQEELASALAALGHLKTSRVSDLAQTIERFNPTEVVPFPPFDGSRFAKLLDEEMGFI